MAAYNYSWHNDNCERSQEHFDASNGYKCFFCKTHNQWAAEVPIKREIIFTYEDGSTLNRVIERKVS